MRKPVRVLIADDHQVVREGLQMILAESDGEIVVVGEASDGDEAVRLATAVKPDVVLMDLSMPRVDGLEADRPLPSRSVRLRSAGGTPGLLVVERSREITCVADAIDRRYPPCIVETPSGELSK